MKKHVPAPVFTKRDLGITSRPHQCKRFLAVFICISVGSYLVIDLNIKTKLSELRERFYFISKPLGVNNTNKAYFVDTEGCKMPSFNIIDDKIFQFTRRQPPINCGKPLTATIGNKIVLNMDVTELRDVYNITELNKISCYCQGFKRKSDWKNKFDRLKIPFNLFEGIEIHAEFVKVACSYDNTSFYKDYHFAEPHSNENGIQESKTEMPSIMILGIDSVSRLNFLRQMNTTATMLRNDLHTVEFIGYNKVGDNTYPNLVPVLSGLDEHELNVACLQQKPNSTYSNCPLIWKRFKEAHFKTVFAEDMASLSLFNYFKRGFSTQPTDYYPRSLFMEMGKHIARMKKVNVHLCLGNRRPVDVIFDYIRSFIPSMQKTPFFSFFWTSSMTHDFLNMPQVIDKDFLELFNTLREANILNRTVLFIMSDHGMRWGAFRKTYQGMMEERQPFLYVVLPNWFSSLYPEAALNLRQNANKLTTHFDLHATLSDLSNLASIGTSEIQKRSAEVLESETLPRGISLFLPIPGTRTCESASIASHWCTCHEKRDIPTNDPRVQRAARFIVKSINDKLQPYPQCRSLFLNSINEAIVAASNKNITQEVQNDFLTDITVRLQTKPGLGEFEATVRLSTESTDLTGTISRTNLYGRQSYCIDNYLLKMYCFCDR